MAPGPYPDWDGSPSMIIPVKQAGIHDVCTIASQPASWQLMSPPAPVGMGSRQHSCPLQTAHCTLQQQPFPDPEPCAPCDAKVLRGEGKTQNRSDFMFLLQRKGVMGRPGVPVGPGDVAAAVGAGLAEVHHDEVLPHAVDHIPQARHQRSVRAGRLLPQRNSSATAAALPSDW